METMVDFTIFLKPTLVLIMLMSVIGFIAYSTILGYHTIRYSMDRSKGVTLFAVYLIGGLILLLLLITSYSLIP